MSILLQVKHLEKKYKDYTAVNDISFEVLKGEILCILGPNGAGKSTTINMLTGSLRNDKGEIVFNLNNNLTNIKSNLKEYKNHLGIVPQDLAVYEDLTAYQNVEFFASLYGLKGKLLKERSLEALEFVGLSKRASNKVNTFSGGMKRRLNIACAIAHRPALLIMDEPTVGIDPQSRNHILETIKTLRDEGMTIIYTTHYMEEVEEISTRIIIIDNGIILTTGTKEELKESVKHEKVIDIEASDLDTFDLNTLYTIEGIQKVVYHDSQLKIASIANIENLDKIILELMKQQKKIKKIETETTSLETVFLNLTGKSLRD